MKADEARLITEDSIAANKSLEAKRALERIEKLREVHAELMNNLYAQILGLAKIGKNSATIHVGIDVEYLVIDILRADGYTVTTSNYDGIRVSWK